MKLLELDLRDLVVSEELSRSGSAKQFEERLRSSIEEIGLAEPIKVAPLPTGKYVVVDGAMRLKVPAYVMDYDRRYELRYQTDIYQDLLPSQLAGLVEHLHRTQHVRKIDIARYIGVSPATLRNYTGLWRLLQRAGLFAKIVDLMDVEVIPSSNPYAWLRLTASGLRYVLEQNFSDGETAEVWIERCVLDARRGKTVRFTIKFVEATTDALPGEYYREGEVLRTVKRDLGLRRAAQSKQVVSRSDDVPLFDMTPEPAAAEAHLRVSSTGVGDAAGAVNGTSGGSKMTNGSSYSAILDSDFTAQSREAIRHLSRISRMSPDPVLRSAARSLKAYLQ
jgi:hypothetical protein